MRRLALIALLTIAAARYAGADRYALLVGNGSAQGDFAPLKYVPNDLRSLKELLTDFCGFAHDRVITLYNGTQADLDSSMASLARRMRQGNRDMFLFYYSGHADRSGLKMGPETYPFDTLKRKLDDFPSDIRIGIFDACQSGGFIRLKGGKLDEPFLFRDDGKIKGQVILCSSSINENAQESDALGNSVFTFYFVNALRGSADVSGDGRVTLSEAYQYSYTHTLSNTAGSGGGVQHPSYQFRIQGEGDIVLADLNRSTRGIRIGAGVRGGVTIVRGETVVADFTKEKDGAITIALSPGTYRIINNRNGERYQATVTLAGNSAATVRQADFSSIAAKRGRAKGGDPADFSFGIAISGGCGSYDFSGLDASLRERFSAYRYFSIEPRFSFPGYFFPLGIAAECLLWNRIEGRIGFRGNRTVTAGREYAGSHAAVPGDASYGVKLHVTHALSMRAVDVGLGCRLANHNRYLKHLSLQAGIDIHSIELNVTTRFSDSLYNVTSEGGGADRGTLLLPYAAAGYGWPLNSWMTAGVRARYRYQRSARELTGSESNERHEERAFAPRTAAAPLMYHAGGIDGALYLKFHFSLSLLQELL